MTNTTNPAPFSPRTRRLAGVIVMAIFVMIMFALVMSMIAAKASTYTDTTVDAAPKPQVVHILDENVHEIPTIPAECLIALDKADSGYSKAYNQVLRNRHLNPHDLRDVMRAIDKQAKAYKTYAEICRQMANNG